MSRSPEKKLALFDFDGTITKNDTLLIFTKFYHGKLKFLFGLLYLSPTLILLKLNLIKNTLAKERFLTYFFAGESEEDFNRKCVEFSKQIVPDLVRSKALETLVDLKKEYEIYVVSASPQNWVKPWCDEVGINCIATRLETDSNKLTGRLLGKNCYGAEKLERINKILDISAYTEILVYGDSKGDIEMSSIATKYHHKSF